MNSKHCVTTILMPNNILYVSINEYYGGEESEPGFITLADNEQDANELCKIYAEKHGLPLFEEYREEL